MASHATAAPWLRRVAPWIGIAAVVIALDQATKIAVERAFQLGDSVAITSFFNLVLAYNKGAAFSFLAAESGWQGVFFTVIGVAASVFIVVLLSKPATQKLFGVALSLILGGAVGNVIDRFAYGHVIDFLDFHAGGWHWPAFNVADSAIVCGAALLVLDEVLRMRKGG